MEPQVFDPSPYPTQLETHAPPRFERAQLLLRVLIVVGLGFLHGSLGGLFGLLYLFLPIVAAILISRRGGEGFLSQDSGWLVGLLEWIVGLYGYLMFVSDRFPLDARARPIRLRARPQGAPSVASSLLRLVASLPHLVLLCVLGIVSALIGLLAAVWILVREGYPTALYSYQRDVLAWTARVLVYHASLVETYPPFSLAGRGPAAPPSERAGEHASA